MYTPQAIRESKNQQMQEGEKNQVKTQAFTKYQD